MVYLDTIINFLKGAVIGLFAIMGYELTKKILKNRRKKSDEK